MDALGVPRMLGGGAGGRAVTAPLPPTPTTRAPSVNVDIKTEQGSVRVKVEEGGAGEGGVAPVAKALKGLSLTLIEKIRAKEKEKNARLAAESGEHSQKESKLVMQFTK